jgi:hypothetical protein
MSADRPPLRIVPPVEMPERWHAQARVAIEQRDLGRVHPLTPLPAARRAAARAQIHVDGPEAA